MLRIVEVMSESGKPMRLNAIAEASGVPSSTAMRILNTLIANKYAKQNEETLLYSLTMKFLMVGTNIRENMSANQIIHPYLQEITTRLNLSCALAVLDRDNEGVVYIDECTSSKQMLRVYHHLGHMHRLHTNASGKLFLSQFSKEAFLSYCRRHKFEPITPKSILTQSDLAQHLQQIKERGYSVNDEESMLGMRCFAVPIFSNEGVVSASISVSGTTYQIPLEQVPSMVAVVSSILERFYEEYAPLLVDANIFSL